jgi:hypothetical protein
MMNSLEKVGFVPSIPHKWKKEEKRKKPVVSTTAISENYLSGFSPK